MNNNITKALEKIITNYRISADMAYSEVTDGVHTEKEYKLALRNIENDTCELIVQEIKQALESVMIKTKVIDKKFSTDERRYPQGYNQAIKDIKSNIKKYLYEN